MAWFGTEVVRHGDDDATGERDPHAVGRGTPMGELLRRYWWPVGISAHLKHRPTFIRVMGEDLVYCLK